ncbi:nuclear transport factor 2 family protein [Streptomyces tsukubensis NRRL18488]|uniref:Nuclear transport factor 2 family protein n=1 Tax=Streptomyces tsukubensis (strain DSM 42081 / NBRC 108919 / NRRL 18488 / 9993) TaxID=1114943 RepID=A0A7G3UPD6_STRT9|nr:nuclear transport factor 2 family protein [Streptomyces tsukubensis NRRL18488]
MALISALVWARSRSRRLVVWSLTLDSLQSWFNLRRVISTRRIERERQTADGRSRSRQVSTTDVIRAYLDIWNERDAAARRELMKSVFTEDSVYTDPNNAGLRGHAELSEVIDRAREGFGDLEFTLDTVVGAHHDRALFTWKLGTATTGYDVVEFTGGRIRSVVGFFA